MNINFLTLENFYAETHRVRPELAKRLQTLVGPPDSSMASFCPKLGQCFGEVRITVLNAGVNVSSYLSQRSQSHKEERTSLVAHEDFSQAGRKDYSSSTEDRPLSASERRFAHTASAREFKDKLN